MAGSRASGTVDFSRAGLEGAGFAGWISVRDLRKSPVRLWPIPNDAVGVYLAFRDSGAPVRFLRHNPAGTWRGDPTLPVALLHERWVEGSGVVYIGKAERPTERSRNSLRRRVRDYLRFGGGSNARHAGGYPTWQLADSERLLVAWRVVRPPASPLRLERRLLDDHVAAFGALPFANSI